MKEQKDWLKLWQDLTFMAKNQIERAEDDRIKRAEDDPIKRINDYEETANWFLTRIRKEGFIVEQTIDNDGKFATAEVTYPNNPAWKVWTRGRIFDGNRHIAQLCAVLEMFGSTGAPISYIKYH